MKILNDVHQQFAAYFPSRILKPYLYLLSKKLSEGHICIDLDNLTEKDISALPDGYIIPEHFPESDPLVATQNEYKPLILHNNYLYLQRYFNYETVILNRLKTFILAEEGQAGEYQEFLRSQTDLLNNLFRKEPLFPGEKKKTDWQLIATISAVLNNFTIITGGPGTGKTTTVAKILTILYTLNPDMKVALAAPTGKAAARMGESLKHAGATTAPNLNKAVKQGFDSLVPSTIHRLLGYQPSSIYFKHDENNPVNYDVVIIDESSMIDIALFAKLFKAIGPKTKLILLGDKDQLASVEAGSLFGDLCRTQERSNLFPAERIALINQLMKDSQQQISKDHISGQSHLLAGRVIELQESHRFSADEGIGKFSKAIIQNNPETLGSFFKNEDARVQIDAHYSDEIFQDFIEGYRAFIEEGDTLESLKKLNDLKVLCVIREGGHGLNAINKKIELTLAKRNLLKITGDFYHNRPVMITSNNYELSLFNGDIGLVRKDDNGELKVWFDDQGNLVSFSPSYISRAETVFAMTIHKSQGSEFDQVMVILPGMEDVPLLTRELLYTAVTRAKRKVIVQGHEAAILQAAHSSVKRGSGITRRINHEQF